MKVTLEERESNLCLVLIRVYISITINVKFYVTFDGVMIMYSLNSLECFDAFEFLLSS